MSLVFFLIQFSSTSICSVLARLKKFRRGKNLAVAFSTIHELNLHSALWNLRIWDKLITVIEGNAEK